METKDNSDLEGDEDSITRIAQQRGFDKCPICWVLVIAKAIVTECGHKFCALLDHSLWPIVFVYVPVVPSDVFSRENHPC